MVGCAAGHTAAHPLHQTAYPHFISEALFPRTGSKVQKDELLDDEQTGPFAPYTILPSQFFDALRHKRPLEGEKRLILSMLEDAIGCFMDGIDSRTKKSQELFREAERWINVSDCRFIFSFDNACEALDIDPEHLRDGLIRWKRKKLAAQHRSRAHSVWPTTQGPDSQNENPD